MPCPSREPGVLCIPVISLAKFAQLGFFLNVKPKRLPSPPYNPGVRNLIADKRAWSQRVAGDEIKRGFLGWHENGYLPHRDEPGLTQFVTFRLADSFPVELRSEWETLFSIEDDQIRRAKLEEYLDRGRGQCHLRRPEIANIMERSLLFRHEFQYELIAWSVMPNHVHVLFEVESIPMSQILDAWKGYTAKEINKVLKTKGKLWQDGYWDTYMRSGEHQLTTRSYIENNPVLANLVKSGKDWPWGSARFRDHFGRLCLSEE